MIAARWGHAVSFLKVLGRLLPLEMMTIAVRLGHAATALSILGRLGQAVPIESGGGIRDEN